MQTALDVKSEDIFSLLPRPIKQILILRHVFFSVSCIRSDTLLWVIPGYNQQAVLPAAGLCLVSLMLRKAALTIPSTAPAGLVRDPFPTHAPEVF